MLTAQEFLGVGPLVNDRKLNSTYRALALSWHPDKTDRKNAEYVFKLIVAAYEAAKRGSTKRSFPALRSMEHAIAGEAPLLCECGWMFENEFMCESCGAFLPGLQSMPDAAYPVREQFWKIARKVCVDRGVSTKLALNAYAQVFLCKPKVLGRNLME